jgi:hypothetical protein
VVSFPLPLSGQQPFRLPVPHSSVSQLASLNACSIAHADLSLEYWHQGRSLPTCLARWFMLGLALHATSSQFGF